MITKKFKEAQPQILNDPKKSTTKETLDEIGERKE
jgi:hypothetical protein